MGLDNSILLTVCCGKIKIPKGFLNENWYDPMTYSVCYWRKCWGIRRKFMNDVFGVPEFTDEYEFTVTPDHIKKMIKVLKYYDNPTTWEADNSHIWNYHDDNIHTLLNNQIRNLKRLYRFLKRYKNRDVVCYFVDSY